MGKGVRKTGWQRRGREKDRRESGKGRGKRKKKEGDWCKN